MFCAGVVPDLLVLASGNPGKLRELSVLLAPLGVTVRPQSDWAVPAAAEDQLTFLENALQKARLASVCSGLPAVADDSGLVVPALGGAPGIRSARYSASGEEAANNARLLSEMAHLDGSQRNASFFCAMVCIDGPDDPAPLVATASWQGSILLEPRGTGGFGYDPLFWVAAHDCSAAELPAGLKNRLSHRGQAARKLLAALASRGNNAIQPVSD